ncbi:MAG: non-hydrolyzing UDP-N-acetylglucosamine 2-epimerase [Pseudonocardiaceae bacterium]
MHRPIALVVGTRPELIKLSPVARCLGSRATVIHTGQHHDERMSTRLATTLGLRGHILNVPSTGAGRGARLGHTVAALARSFTTDLPSAVVVQGDTTSALAGALAANHADLPLVHVEAGLRSFDRTMPEELNRTLIDHLADLCCAPTALNRSNLLAETIPDHRIVITGNTIVDAVHRLLPDTRSRSETRRHHGLQDRGYILATLHRPENVDHRPVLELLLDQLALVPAPIVLPLHPRTAARVESFGLGFATGALRVTEPLDYPEFLALAHDAALLITDSGGLQEEASVLKTPIITVRRSTERPEIEGTFGVRVLPSDDLARIADQWLADRRHARRLASLPSPFGDGFAAERIVQALNDHLTSADQRVSAVATP